jgi:hypothetical protein
MVSAQWTSRLPKDVIQLGGPLKPTEYRPEIGPGPVKLPPSVLQNVCPVDDCRTREQDHTQLIKDQGKRKATKYVLFFYLLFHCANVQSVEVIV